jgi:Stress responsive A/B Barrel Domain
MALRHVVMFRFGAGTSEEQVRALADGLDRMPGAVGTMVDYRHGRDAGVTEGAYDYVVVGDFATVDDYLTYRNHPDHQALIRDLVRPILAERASIQFELGD